MEKEIIFTNDAPLPQGAYSQAIKYGDLIFISGQIPIDMNTGIINTEGIHKEMRIIMHNISAILNAARSSMAKIIKFTVYLKAIDDSKWVDEILRETIGDNFPARAIVAVSDLPKNVNIEIDVIAGR
jgi:2-iminobutanoate/2-iminopropanoate deaminase